jgi:hypothetical protein
VCGFERLVQREMEPRRAGRCRHRSPPLLSTRFPGIGWFDVPLPEHDSNIPIDAIDGDWIKRRRAESYAVRVVAQAGDRYVVTLNGSTDELAPAVVYYGGRLSHVAALGSHLKMFNAYVDGFTGSAEERQLVETRVRELLDSGSR